MAPAQRLQGLQALRAVAALVVVFAHIGFELNNRGAALYDGWIGAIGVDIFFVISGYIMFRIMGGTAKGLQSSLLFMAHRIGRIVPIYWLVAVLVLAAWLLTGRDELIDATRLHPSPLRLIATFGFATANPFVLVGWTLAFEMFFYLLSAMAIAALRTIGARFVFVSAILVILATVGQLSGLTRPFFLRKEILEFALGGAIFLLTHRYRLPAWTAAVALAGALIGGVLLYGNHDQNHGAVSWIAVAGASVFAAVVAEDAVPWHRFPLGQALGDASYSLYLIHLYVVMAVGIMVFEYGHASAGHSAAFAVLVLSALAASALALSVYSKVERPLARWATRRLVDLVTRAERFPPFRRRASAADAVLGAG